MMVDIENDSKKDYNNNNIQKYGGIVNGKFITTEKK